MGLYYTESGEVLEAVESLGEIRATLLGVRIPVRIARWLMGATA